MNCYIFPIRSILSFNETPPSLHPRPSPRQKKINIQNPFRTHSIKTQTHRKGPNEPQPSWAFPISDTYWLFALGGYCCTQLPAGSHSLHGVRMCQMGRHLEVRPLYTRGSHSSLKPTTSNLPNDFTSRAVLAHTLGPLPVPSEQLKRQLFACGQCLPIS